MKQDQFKFWVDQSDLGKAETLAWSNYYFRVVTAVTPIDEPFAIAPMLAISEAGMATLVQWTGEDRVVQLWKLIGRVPRNIVFVSYPRLRKENFTWAPQSLMALRESPSLDSWPDALTSTVTEEALHGTFLIYELDSKIYVTETKSHIRVVGSTRRQTIGVATTRSDFEETKEEVHEYDAIAAFAQPNSK